MMQSKILKLGDSSVMTLTDEMLSALDVEEGDTLFVVRGDDGSLHISSHDPVEAKALRAAEAVMEENHDLLAALA